MGFWGLRITATSIGILLFSTASFADLGQGSCPSGTKPPVNTTHTAIIEGKEIDYNASAGFLEVTAADGKSKACIFYTSYSVPSVGVKRPITFAFNGGPGSASLWLHMGVVAPQHVDMGPEGLTTKTPLQLTANSHSFLSMSDYVMIDPVATGFSAPEGNVAGDKFFGAKNDYQSVAEFIRTYLDTFNRWDAPKYVMGESYGGIRGSLLAHHLQADLGIFLNGVVFVSPWLSTTTTNFAETDNDLPYVTFLPTFATTGWYHNKLAEKYQSLDVSVVLKTAETFARGRYWNALQQGNDLDEAEFHAVAKMMSELTGLPQQKIEDMNLRVADTDFFSGLLESQNQVVGRYDSRFVGGRLPTENGATAGDPSDDATNGPFTAAINFYLRNDLKFLSPSPYVGLANIQTWPMESDGREYGVMDDVSKAMISNPSLKIFVASGIYDLAVPYETVRYNFEHLAPHLDLNKRVTISQYPGGHMMYINPVALEKLKTDLNLFYSN